MSEWQPIETAPKDEDALLLYREGYGVLPGWWDSFSMSWVSVETQVLTGGRFAPTHWMLLPDPPVEPR